MALIKSYCVTSEPPVFPAHLIDVVVGVRGYQPTDGVSALSAAQFWAKAGPCALTSAGSYLIPSFIKDDRPSELVAVFSNERLIVRAQHSGAAPVTSFYRVPTSQTGAIPRQAVEPWPGFSFLVGVPLKFEQGIVDQYIQSHRAIDLFDYVTLAVEEKIITLTEANQFARELELIPGGCELGVYPTSWFINAMGKLDRLGKAFLERFSSRVYTYEETQMRVIDFLSERLGSFLLLKELRTRYPDGMPSEIFGAVCVLDTD